MTPDKALFAYMNNFMRAYAVTAVPNDVLFPYMTYETPMAAFEDGPVAAGVNIYMRTESEADPNKMAADFRKYITENDCIECDGGYIWIIPGNPWATAQNDQLDSKIKSRHINVFFEYEVA